MPQLRNTLALIYLVPQLVHRAYLDELAKLSNDGFPQGIHLDGLRVLVVQLLLFIND